ncbi:tetratricopeptide repeat protein [Sphingobacterium sp. SYP-B4668]|uniref:tetratricopeptide repeat protein n=1 Tax=Sphingobacterium sp. SYP-B4668 TaxID=2996035 RepID=UPI0022DD36F2|nr:hypothetical protein [Sphingobacterium sp. SYP-B4668]
MEINLISNSKHQDGLKKWAGVLCLLAVLVTTLHWPSFLLTSSKGYGATAISLTIVLLGIAIGSLFRKNELQIDVLDGLVFLIALWTMASSYFHGRPQESFIPIIQICLSYFLLKSNRDLFTQQALGYSLLLLTGGILLQLLFIERIFHTFQYTEYGLLENHTTLAIFLAIALPIIITAIKGRPAKIVLSCMITGIILYYSRTAFIALLTSAILYLIILRIKRKYIILSIVAAVMVVIFLAGRNMAPIEGRLLIWKIALHDIDLSSSIIGKGHNYINDHYLDVQASYFATTRPIKEQLLAGQVHSTFNEAIRILIEGGLIGLGLWGMLVYVVYKRLLLSYKGSAATFISITAFMLIASFSYPLASLSVTLSMILIIVLTLPAVVKGDPLTVTLPVGASRYAWVCAVLILAPVGYSSYTMYRDIQAWTALKKNRYIIYNEGLYVERASALFHELDHHPKIVHGYATDLYSLGLYEQALETALLAKGLYANLHINQLIGSIYEELDEAKNAESYYMHAMAMVPKIYASKYLLFNFYKEQGDRHKAVRLASIISNYPVKIESEETRQIKNEINEYLTKFNGL